MAGRRLKSDRFFAYDHTPEVYTRDGIDYIRENGMASVLRRHLPSLAPALRGVDNPFAPWRAVAGTAPYSGHIKGAHEGGTSRRFTTVLSGGDS
jgi:hypothetical protein